MSLPWTSTAGSKFGSVVNRLGSRELVRFNVVTHGSMRETPTSFSPPCRHVLALSHLQTHAQIDVSVNPGGFSAVASAKSVHIRFHLSHPNCDDFRSFFPPPPQNRGNNRRLIDGEERGGVNLVSATCVRMYEEVK